MIPLPCQFVIAVAAWIVPKSKRAEWKQEWRAELWHKAQSGADWRELLCCAWGAFRDAAWILESERKRRGFDVFRKPLRTEVAFLVAAFLLAGISGGLNAPKLPFSNAARLITVNHPVHFAGARDSMFQRKYVALVRLQSQSLQDMLVYRAFRDKNLGMLVSRNMLSVLGSEPMLGRGFIDGDADSTAILSEEFWRTRFQSDRAVINTSVLIDARPYTVIGVMPRRFWFISDRVRFYAPLDRLNVPVGFVGLLAAGETVSSAEDELRRIAGEVENPLVAEGLEAKPMLQDPRPQELAFAAIVALAGALLGMAFLLIKRLGGLRYWLVLGARLTAVLLALGLLRIFLLALGSSNGSTSYTTYSLVSVWIYLLICFAAMCLLIIDHRGRCLQCFVKLRMPAPIGVWSSSILDQPITEYVCPAGHGALVVAGTGDAPDHWTVLDETWQDLFAHTED